MSEKTRAQTAAATEAKQRQAAERALDDPIKLLRALRIARLAIARGKLTVEDLVADAPKPVRPTVRGPIVAKATLRARTELARDYPATIRKATTT